MHTIRADTYTYAAQAHTCTYICKKLVPPGRQSVNLGMISSAEGDVGGRLELCNWAFCYCVAGLT